MNIIHLTSERNRGDQIQHIFNLCKAQLTDGQNAMIILPPESGNTLPSTENIPTTRMALSGLWGITAPVKIASMLNKTDGTTILHAHDIPSVYVAVNTKRLSKNPEKIRVVATTDTFNIKKREHETLNAVDAIIFHSDDTYKEFLSIPLPSTERPKTYLIHKTIHTRTDRQAKPTGIINIAFIGTIDSESELPTLINALESTKHNEIRLTIYGTGRGRDVMPIVRATRHSDIAGKIDWQGEMAPTDAVFDNAHIVFLPPIKHSINTSVIKAMNHGCAVITADSPINREYFENDKNIILYPAGNSTALTKLLSRLIIDEKYRNDIACGGVSLIHEGLTFDSYYKNTTNIYYNIL